MIPMLFFAFLLSTSPLFANVAPMILLQEVVQKQEISYIKHRDPARLSFLPFPLSASEESSWSDPLIPETFILTIPKGTVYSANGLVFFQMHLIKELLWRWSYLRHEPLDVSALSRPKYVPGKVVVLAQEGQANYYHWMVEVLPKIAMLEEKNIAYDWLYVPTRLPFMRQTLSLLGIPQEKILEATPNAHIEADELIVPSAPALSCYTPRWIVDYLRERLIPQAEQARSQEVLSKKIFISRKKASYRRIINEDEVFRLFEPLGFVRYNLEDLTVLEQVQLFHNADVIVAPHGAGLVNLVFAKPNALVVELFQEHQDDSFWYLSQVVGLRHHCIKTTEFRKGGGYTDTTIPLPVIEDIIKELESI